MGGQIVVVIDSLVTDLLAGAISYFMAALFAHAGASKWRSPEAYQETVAAVLGLARAAGGVRLIASVEIAVAALVLLPVSRGVGLLASGVILIAYAGAMGWQLRQGNVNLRCGCSGPASDTRISPELVWRNVSLAAGAFWATAGALPGQLETTALAMSLSLALLCMYAAADQLIQNRQRWLRGVNP